MSLEKKCEKQVKLCENAKKRIKEAEHIWEKLKDPDYEKEYKKIQEEMKARIEDVLKRGIKLE